MSGGTNALKSLPPHIARELRRHVSPNKLTTTGSSSSSSSSQQLLLLLAEQQQQKQKRRVLIGCTLFTTFSASLPIVLYYWVGPLNEKDAPLTAPQVRRGAFQNSGTKDIGKDPDWNFSNGTHKLRAGYGNTVTTNDDGDNSSTSSKANTLPAEFLAMAPNDLRKVEDKIEAFAKGRGRNN